MTDEKPPRARKLVCRCREVTEDDVLAAVEDGARSLRGVKLRTLATTGLCQGHTCGPLIEAILRRTLRADYLPDDRPARAPVRPTPVDVLAGAPERRTAAGAEEQ